MNNNMKHSKYTTIDYHIKLFSNWISAPLRVRIPLWCWTKMHEGISSWDQRNWKDGVPCRTNESDFWIFLQNTKVNVKPATFHVQIYLRWTTITLTQDWMLLLVFTDLLVSWLWTGLCFWSLVWTCWFDHEHAGNACLEWTYWFKLV